jgi:hypothetical protein
MSSSTKWHHAYQINSHSNDFRDLCHTHVAFLRLCVRSNGTRKCVQIKVVPCVAIGCSGMFGCSGSRLFELSCMCMVCVRVCACVCVRVRACVDVRVCVCARE